MNHQFEPLDPNEVISTGTESRFGLPLTFKTSDLIQAIRESVSGYHDRDSSVLTEDGLECEVLRYNSNGWQKGRIRLVVVEFCPDGPEVSAPPEAEELTEQEASPLDEVRKMMADDQLNS